MPGRASMSADADDNWSVCTSFSVCLSFSVGLSPSRRTVRRVRRDLGAAGLTLAPSLSSDATCLVRRKYSSIALRGGLFM